MDRTSQSDPVFRGCTRKAMMLGVPMIPLLCVLGSILLLSMYFSLWLMAAAIPSVLTLRQVCANDDAFFDLLILRVTLRLRFSNLGLGSRLWRLPVLQLREGDWK